MVSMRKTGIKKQKKDVPVPHLCDYIVVNMFVNRCLLECAIVNIFVFFGLSFPLFFLIIWFDFLYFSIFYFAFRFFVLIMGLCVVISLWSSFTRHIFCIGQMHYYIYPPPLPSLPQIDLLLLKKIKFVSVKETNDFLVLGKYLIVISLLYDR